MKGKWESDITKTVDLGVNLRRGTSLVSPNLTRHTRYVTIATTFWLHAPINVSTISF